MDTQLYLIRHGESEWNRLGRLQGQTDVPLCQTGRAQAQALASRLARMPLAAVYASDLARAQETARIVAAAHPDRPAVCLEPRLREIDVGQAVGLTWQQVAERWPEAARAADPDRPRYPGGESLNALAARALAAVRDIAARYPGERVAVVTHGGLIKTLVWQVLRGGPEVRDRFTIANCSLTRLIWGPSGGRIGSLNDTAHLE